MKKFILLIITCFYFLFSYAFPQQWVKCENGIFGENIQAIAANGNNIYAGSHGYGIYLSTDDGASWKNISTELDNQNVVSLEVNGSNLYAGFEGGGGGLYFTTDNGDNWEKIRNGITNNMIYSIIIDGTNILIGTWGGGIFSSTNNGATWNPKNQGLENLEVNCMAKLGSDIFAGTQRKGVYRSADYGQSWNQSGLSNSTVFGLKFSDTYIFAAILDDVAIKLSTDNGESWIDMNNGFTSNWGMRFHVMDSIILVGSWGEGVFMSTNKGVNWSEFNSGLTGINILDFASSSSNIFVTTQDAGVFKMSNDFLPVEESNNIKNLKLFPNPADDFIYLDFGSKQQGKIQIFSVMGEKVIETELVDKIDVCMLSEGMYYALINSGKNIESKIFVVIR